MTRQALDLVPRTRHGARTAAREEVARSVAVAGDWTPELQRELEDQGWHVVEWPTAGEPVAQVQRDGVVLVVTRSDDPDAGLSLAERILERGQAERLALLVSGGEAAWRWAARLTAWCWPSTASPRLVAELLERTREQRQARAALHARQVVVRLWEGVEVDGSEVYLGVAERNLLYLLASRAGERVAKDADVDCGKGRSLPALECRKRLARRLGHELTELLVPAQRCEPYRFREPAEVEAVTRAHPARHPFTQLRVIGRGSVRALPAWGGAQ